MIVIYIIGGLIATVTLLGFILKIVYDFPIRKREPGFEYVHVELDGSVRELDDDEKKYLQEEFHPNDGARPYIKSSYNQKTPDGKISGFIKRRRVPQHILIGQRSEKSLFNNELIKLCRLELGEFIESFGFQMVDIKEDLNGMSLTYLKDNKQVVKLYSDTNLRDYPYFFNICFNLWDGRFSHVDHNSIPLWYIKESAIPNSNAKEYNLADIGTMDLVRLEKLPWIIKAAKADLEKFGTDFLKGDLEQFNQLRQKRANEKANR